MRLVILADTHGNLPALEAVLAETRKQAPDGYVIAGDLTAGPHPDETIRLLQELNSWMIAGNSDLNLLRYASGQAPAYWYTHQRFALLRWNHKRIGAAYLELLSQLPLQRVVALPGTAPIHVVHGSPRDPYESIFPDEDPQGLARALALVTAPVLICGHTHQPWIVEKDGRLALNPGSVAGPLNGDTRAQYALLTWTNGRWQAELHAAAYDLRKIRAAFVESGLLEDGGALARCFLLGIETGHDFTLRFLEYAHELAEREGCGDSEVIPDPIWERAEASFDWSATRSNATQPQ